MPVEKLSISLPQDLARRLDELAEEAGVSRSSLVQEATARFIASKAADAEATRRRNGVAAALAGFDEVATSWGEDGRPGIEYLADIRDTDGPSGGTGGPGHE